MAEEIHTAQTLATLVQGVVWSLLAVLLAWKGLPALFALIHELGVWRGTIGSRLESMEKDMTAQLDETRCGFRENRDQHRKIHEAQNEHGERLARVESNGRKAACPLAKAEPG